MFKHHYRLRSSCLPLLCGIIVPIFLGTAVSDDNASFFGDGKMQEVIQIYEQRKNRLLQGHL